MRAALPPRSTGDDKTKSHGCGRRPARHPSTGLAFAENYAHGVGTFSGGTYVMLGGAACMAACRVFGLFRASWYAGDYRKRLGTALGVDP